MLLISLRKFRGSKQGFGSTSKLKVDKGLHIVLNFVQFTERVLA